MVNMDQQILALLKKSKLSKFYKTLLTNLLPSLDPPRKEDLLATLLTPATGRNLLKSKQEFLLQKYSDSIEAIEEDPEFFFTLEEFQEKVDKKSSTKENADKARESMKNKLELSQLKQGL